MANEKYGFIIHPDEWRMARDVLEREQIADALFPVLDACLLEADPSEAIGEIIQTNLCARLFWDRNVRDIDRYKNNREAANERKRKFREAHAKTERGGTDGNATERGGTERNGGNAPYTNTNTNSNTDSNTNTNTKSKTNNNRSVTVAAKAERNGNGTEDVLLKGGVVNARRLAKEFAEAVKRDEGAFFSGKWSAATICHALTGDYRSTNRWLQLARQKGEAQVIEECFAFWREIGVGEDVDNRGKALNARLAKLPDQPKPGKEG